MGKRRCVMDDVSRLNPLIKKFDFLRVRQLLVFVALKMYWQISRTVTHCAPEHTYTCERSADQQGAIAYRRADSTQNIAALKKCVFKKNFYKISRAFGSNYGNIFNEHECYTLSNLLKICRVTASITCSNNFFDLPNNTMLNNSLYVKIIIFVTSKS